MLADKPEDGTNEERRKLLNVALLNRLEHSQNRLAIE